MDVQEVIAKLQRAIEGLQSCDSRTAEDEARSALEDIASFNWGHMRHSKLNVVYYPSRRA